MSDRLGCYLQDSDDRPVGYGRYIGMMSVRTADECSASSHPPSMIETTARRASTASSSTSHSCADSLSNVSSTSTSLSTAPSAWVVRVPHQDNTSSPANTGYRLPCEFAFTGCEMDFGADEFRAWISHSLSHFGVSQPPPKSLCTFCDAVSFESQNFRQSEWIERMIHVAGHYQKGDTGPRPDFFILEYMRDRELISAEDFAHAREYTERKYCDHLVGDNFRTPEQKKREDRKSWQSFDQAKEDRERRRKQQRNKGRGGCLAPAK